MSSPAASLDAFSNASALIAHERADERAFAAELMRAVGVGRSQQAQNGSHAQWLIKEFSYDVAVIDWSLGGMGALDFVHDLRRLEDEKKRALPVMLLSARAGRADIDAAIAGGVDSFVIKPVSPAVMAKRLAAVITRPRDFITAPGYVGPCRRRGANTGYAGPFRRASDKARLEPFQTVGSTEWANLRAAASAQVDALLLRLDALEQGQPGAMDKFMRDVQALRRSAHTLNDQDLERGAAALIAYVSNGSTLFDIARTHLAALRHLTGAAGMEPALRKAVAAELERMAAKVAARLTG
jgi:DNA-binding response OmpR family regulator